MNLKNESVAKTKTDGILFTGEAGIAGENQNSHAANIEDSRRGGKEEGMAGSERLMLIRQKVQTEKKASVGELSRICRVTEETIRRDLDKLEAEGVITRVHGGAIWNEEIQKGNEHFYKRHNKNLKEKQEIARKTVEILKGKNTIIADSSTTVQEALKLIPETEYVTVVTNSTEVFREFQSSNINFVSTGGEFNKRSLSLQGTLTKENIQKYNVKLTVIGCKGLSLGKGVFDSNEREAAMKEAMLEQGQEVALLADHSKFDRTAFVHLIDIDKLDYIITDCRPSDEWVAYCEEHGVKLIW